MFARGVRMKVSRVPKDLLHELLECPLLNLVAFRNLFNRQCPLFERVDTVRSMVKQRRREGRYCC